MAGKKKKHARPGASGQMHGHGAGSAGSMPSTAPVGEGAKAPQDAQPQEDCSTEGDRDTGDTANTASTSLQGTSDALAELHISGRGVQQVAASKQRLGRQGGSMQARPASATGSAYSTEEAPDPDLDGAKVVAQLNSSNEESLQVILLQQVCHMAECSPAHRSALIAAGIMPALLRVVHSSIKAVQREVSIALTQLLWGLKGPAFDKSIIGAQLVPLLRHHNEGVRHFALDCLEHASCAGEMLAQSIVAAGAIPAVTQALHNGSTEARLCAASLLLHLQQASGMGINTALAGALPVAMAALQCGSPEEQLQAVCLLSMWASEYEAVSAMVVAQGGIPALVPLLSSPDTQQEVLQLLERPVLEEEGARVAVAEGAIPALVKLLRGADVSVRIQATFTLGNIVRSYSQAASTAVAAGAVQPLVKMLHSSNAGPAVCSLYGIASSGDAQCRTAIVKAGAVAAICAALPSMTDAELLLALQPLVWLSGDPTVAVAVDECLAPMLDSSRDPKLAERIRRQLLLR